MRSRVVVLAGGRWLAAGGLMLALVLVAAACSGGEVAVDQQDDSDSVGAAAEPVEDGQSGQGGQQSGLDGQDDGQAAGRDEDSTVEVLGSSTEGSGDADAAGPVDHEGDAAGRDTAGPTGDGTPAPARGSDGAASSAPQPVTQAGRARDWTMTHRRPPRGAGSACRDVTATSPGAFFVYPDDGITAGARPVTVEFLGCSDTFEANVVYEAYHGKDKAPTLTGFTMGGTLGDWAQFRFEAAFWTPGTWTVIVLEDDAETGKRKVYDRVTFTVDPS